MCLLQRYSRTLEDLHLLLSSSMGKTPFHVSSQHWHRGLETLIKTVVFIQDEGMTQDGVWGTQGHVKKGRSCVKADV